MGQPENPIDVDYEDHEKAVETVVWVYLAPVILVAGIFGNSLTVVILRRKRFIASTVSLYLPLMAVADSCVLVIGIVVES